MINKSIIMILLLLFLSGCASTTRPPTEAELSMTVADCIGFGVQCDAITDTVISITDDAKACEGKAPNFVAGCAIEVSDGVWSVHYAAAPRFCVLEHEICEGLCGGSGTHTVAMFIRQVQGDVFAACPL